MQIIWHKTDTFFDEGKYFLRSYFSSEEDQIRFSTWNIFFRSFDCVS